MSNFDVGANAFVSDSHIERTIGPNPITERGRPTIINAHSTLPLIIYPSGKYIVVKNLEKPSECFIYRGHSALTTVAKFSPNGYWVASADRTGKVRVWSWDNPEHLTKLESPVFAGEVIDLDWDMESKKIVVCGENGSGFSMKCFTWDTGNSVGEMVGHTKRVCSVAYKPSRPFRIMTGSEDCQTVFFQGPPFKMDHSNPVHTNFVNSVRYTPDGKKVISVGTDKKIQMYDGATGVPLDEVKDAHAGGIYGVCFSPDGSQFATASADKTIKVWDTESMTLQNTINIASVAGAPQIGDMQVSIVWSKACGLLSLSLNGSINMIDTASDNVMKVVQCNQSSLSALYIDPVEKMLYTGSHDGVICSRPLDSLDTSVRLQGETKFNLSSGVHGGKVVGINVQEGRITSVGWDDTIRTGASATNVVDSVESLPGQPCAMAKSPSSDLCLVVTNAELGLYRGGVKVGGLSMSTLSWSASCGAILNEEEVAVGGSDSKTHIFSLSADFTFTEVKTIDTRSAVSAVTYSPAGDLLAIGDVGRQVEVYERGSWTAKIQGKWVYHTSTITALAWSPSGNLLASGSLDENIYVWNYLSPMKRLQLPLSHSMGVTGLSWSDEQKIFSIGNDGVVGVWNIPAEI
jgi:WD40 repeat protein